MKKRREGPWIQTATGRAFYYDSPKPDQISIIDIASGLSRLCRYGGQLKDCAEFEDDIYPVGQHSVLVYKLLKLKNAPVESWFWGLMHDGSEAFTVDLPSPMKSLIPAYKEYEEVAASAIRETFHIPYSETIEKFVKWADVQLLLAESDVLCAIPSNQWDRPHGADHTLYDIDHDFYLWRPKKAKKEFLECFNEINNILGLENGYADTFKYAI